LRQSLCGENGEITQFADSNPHAAAARLEAFELDYQGSWLFEEFQISNQKVCPPPRDAQDTKKTLKRRASISE
jgi:hypothetical protein